MYLSRVEIEQEDRRKIRDLNHLGAYHSWVENSFVNEFNLDKRTRKLWRIDEIHDKKYLLIVSENMPDLECLEKYGVKGSAECKSYLPFLESLDNGQTFRFKATLNPVVSVSTGKLSGKRGRVFPLLSDGSRREYFKNKSEKNGFYIGDDDFYISHSDFEILKKTYGNSGSKTVKINKVTYEGRLRITDVVAFRELLVKGMGKKRAYGCGMITIIKGS